MKTIRNISLFAMVLVAMVACKEDKRIPNVKEAITPASIVLSMPQVQEQLIYTDETEAQVLPLIVGESVQLGCVLTPDNVTFQNVTWSSSNEGIVSVTSSGLIKALAEEGVGYSIINVIPVGMYSGSGVTASIKVKVSASLVPATSLELATDLDSIYEGETTTIKTTILPATATYRTVKWESSNEDYAVVDKYGVVTGKPVTTGVENVVEISATTLDGSKIVAKQKIKVKKIVDPTSITINPKFAKDKYECCMQSKKLQLDYTMEPSYATKSRVTWTSSDPTIATVENGVVTFNQDGNFGEFTITATCPNNASSSIEMNLPVGLIRELFDDPNNITWRDANQSGNGTSTSYVWNPDSTITITTYKQNATKQRADIKCWATPVYICPDAYPIVAIRMDDVKDKYAPGVTARNINFDTSGNDLSDGTKFSGNVGGSNNKYLYDYKCSDGSHVFIYDLKSQTFATGGAFPSSHVGKFTTFQFKHADIATATEQLTFNLYWVQSFKTLQALKDYLTSEGLTWEE